MKTLNKKVLAFNNEYFQQKSFVIMIRVRFAYLAVQLFYLRLVELNVRRLKKYYGNCKKYYEFL